LHPHPSVSSIPIPPHVSLQQQIPVNNGQNDVVNPPQIHVNGCSTMSFPLPPPPAKWLAQRIALEVSHAHSTQPLKRPKSLAQEIEPSKGKQLANSAKSDQSEASSHSITSHSHHPWHEDGYTPFEDMHPEASTVKGKMSIKEDSRMPKLKKSKESKRRRTASHKKIGFFILSCYLFLVQCWDKFYLF